MGAHRNNIYDLAYVEYLKGFSLSQVAKKFGVTRQSVFKAFQRRGFKLRSKKCKSFVVFNEKKYSMKSNGYYYETSGKRSLLHRDVWEYYTGEKIPEGWEVHHLNGDKKDNRMVNLQCLPKQAHTRLYSPHNNQFTRGNPNKNNLSKQVIT